MQTLNQNARCRPFGTANVRQLRRAQGCRAQNMAVAAPQPSSFIKLSNLPTLPPLDGSYESKVAFTGFANWLIPDSVMLGRYPYVEPSRCSRREQGEVQLQEILGSGITTFVSLQGELPPQEKMTLAGKSGFLPYKATADLIRSSLNGPPPMEIVEGLRNPMLNKFLPTRKRQSGAPYNPVTLQFLHFPIMDLDIPDSTALSPLLADLERRISAGEKLYIHCWGGRGRAGTVGACLLAHAYRLPVEECLQRVQRAFDTRHDGGRLSPETQKQFDFVANYVKAIQQ